MKVRLCGDVVLDAGLQRNERARDKPLRFLEFAARTERSASGQALYRYRLVSMVLCENGAAGQVHLNYSAAVAVKYFLEIFPLGRVSDFAGVKVFYIGDVFHMPEE